MDTSQNGNASGQKGVAKHVAVVVVVAGAIAVAALLAHSGFDFTDFVIKLHGG